MTVFVCVSDGGGMTFAGRRVSRDARVIDDITALSSEGGLFISQYSSKLFPKGTPNITIVKSPLDSAEHGEFVFAENFPLAPYADKISRLIIYHWNRRYPFDTRLDLSPRELGMKLFETDEFQGKSHDRITREIWVR